MNISKIIFTLSNNIQIKSILDALKLVKIIKNLKLIFVKPLSNEEITGYYNRKKIIVFDTTNNKLGMLRKNGILLNGIGLYETVLTDVDSYNSYENLKLNNAPDILYNLTYSSTYGEWIIDKNNDLYLATDLLTGVFPYVYAQQSAGTKFKHISGSFNGAQSFAAIKTDGTLWTWGANDVGQVGDGTTTSRATPGLVAGDPGTWTWKYVISKTANPGMLAIKTDGTLWTWGTNSSGELGDGTTTSRSSPGTTAGGGTTWNIIDASPNRVAAIKTDGTLWSWGFNLYGGLGDGTINDKSSPVTTAGGGTTWSQVSCGYYNTAAIKTDGTLWTWGVLQSSSSFFTFTSALSPVQINTGTTVWKEIGACHGQPNNIKIRLLDTNSNFYVITSMQNVSQITPSLTNVKSIVPIQGSIIYINK